MILLFRTLSAPPVTEFRDRLWNFTAESVMKRAFSSFSISSSDSWLHGSTRMHFARRQMKRLLPALLLSVFMMSQVYAHPTLVLNTANDPPNSTMDHTGLADRVIKEACARIGLNVEIVKLPSERALINANKGIDDGNFCRVEGIDSIYTNLIRVPEEIIQFRFVAFTKNFNLKTTGWESLKPYHVGIVTGWKILENNIVATKSLTKVKDDTTLFHLLDRDRVDLVVYDMTQGLACSQTLKLQNVAISSPPLAIKGMYLYLNKKHSNLVPLFTEAIRNMKEDGTYNKIAAETTP